MATVYRRRFWDAVLGARLPDGIDHAVIDFAVNSGSSRAAKFLRAIARTAQGDQIGPATLAVVREADRVHAITKLCNNRLAFLERLSTCTTFGRGWTARVRSVGREAILIAQKADRLFLTLGGFGLVSPPKPHDLSASALLSF